MALPERVNIPNGTSTPVSQGRNARRKASGVASASASAKGKVKPTPTPISPSLAKGKEKAVQPLLEALRVPSTSASAGESSKLGESSRSKDSWECIPIAQNETSSVPPVWSKDGRFYFTVSSNSIHIHSTAPQFPRLSTLSSHTRTITSLHLSPLNPFQIMTSSEDGTIKIWDWVAGRLVRTIDFKEPQAKVSHLAFGEILGKWWIFVAVSHVKEGGKPVHRVVRVPLAASSTSAPHPSPIAVGKLSAPIVSLMLSPRSTYLVALAANKAYTYRMPPSTNGSAHEQWTDRPTCVKFVSDQPFTCGAFSPDKILAAVNEEEWFATGDQKGVIRLWHGLGQAFRQIDHAGQASSEAEKRLPTTSLHWHAHAVAAIAFTPSGSQLLSVGEESVLVQWHLASGKREYIPRLGGRPIVSLAVRRAANGVEEEWWMSLADGAVVRVGASSGQIANVGQGIRLDPLRPTSKTSTYPMALHPATNALVVPSSHPSTLQFIDPIASSVLFDLEVAPSNRISRRDDKEVEPVIVEKVAISDTQEGQSLWMATTEGRNGDELEGGGKVKNLKLWKWVDEKYLVNTQFPRPHGISDISSVVFSHLQSSTQHPYLLTTSIDGIAKLWQVRQAKKSEQGKVAKKDVTVELYWSCRSTFDYRNMPIHDVAFSPDSTIVALSHGSAISLWDVETNVLLKVLDTNLASDVVKLGFVGSEGRHLAGACSLSGLAVWDLLSCEIAWTAPRQPIQSLLTSIAASFFVVVADGNNKNGRTRINIFDPSFPNPIRMAGATHSVKHVVWLPNTSKTGETHRQLHFVGSAPSGEIYRFGDISSSANATGATVVSQATEQKAGLSVWQEMFGKDAFLDDPAPQVNATATATATALQQRIVSRGNIGQPTDVFEGPSHTMPPTSMLFDAFMDELLSGHSAEVPTIQLDDQEGRKDEIIYQDVGASTTQTTSTTTSNTGSKARVVDDEEVSNLTTFFKQVLSSKHSPSQGHSKPQSKVNGHTHLNGNSNGDIATTTPIKQHLVTPAKKLNGSVGKNENVEQDTPSISASGKKGKKRKAPRDE